MERAVPTARVSPDARLEAGFEFGFWEFAGVVVLVALAWWLLRWRGVV